MTSSSMWRAEILMPALESEYDDLVAKATASPLSHTLVWRDVLLDLGMGEPVYWLAFRGDQLLGALPAFVQRSELGVVLNSLPFIQSPGSVIGSADLDRSERAELVKVLIGAMLDWCRGHAVRVACVIGSAFGNQDDEASFPLPPSFRMERTVRGIDLTQPLNFRPSVQEMIEKARRSNPIMREAASLEEAKLVYDIYAANMQRIGVTPNAWDTYKCIYVRAAGKGWTKFIWAEVDSEPVAGLIAMWHGGIVDYFSVGSTELGRRIQANSWLCNQQITIAKEAGIRWWNWMASPSQQVYDFKKRWGGMDCKYLIWGWQPGDVSELLKLAPSELIANFPGYFVLPFDWLSKGSA